jgi:hypothetical protein
MQKEVFGQLRNLDANTNPVHRHQFAAGDAFAIGLQFLLQTFSYRRVEDGAVPFLREAVLSDSSSVHALQRSATRNHPVARFR